jgi:uncharacterized SAM-binding protein YcdF (DUF218 family)
VRTLKALEVFFVPSTMIVLGIGLALFYLARRRPRAAGVVLAFVLAGTALLGMPWAARAAVGTLERPFSTSGTPDREPSAIVVLAGASNIYPDGRVDLNAASWRRLWLGIETYHAFGGRVPLVYAGGSFNRSTGAPIESPVIAKVAVRAGVAPSHLIFEDGSSTTFESAQGISRLWPGRFQDAPRRIVLVTSAWHMRRSAAVFRRQGFEVNTISTDFRADVRDTRRPEWLPTLEAFGLTELAWREWASVLLYDWTGRT